LAEAWSRDVAERTRQGFAALAQTHARRCGRAQVCDANEAALKLSERDLAFIDPPYSGVHYSRFYHVLETVAQGECGEVSGVGRYPAVSARPWSRYSVTSESKRAFSELLKTISSRGARTIVTFPLHECSNGLSGPAVREVATQYFHLDEQLVSSRFRSLGGGGVKTLGCVKRDAIRRTDELLLVLRPR
jgi:hypothetical protein